MINSIQYLRGISALFVVLFHMKWMVNNVYVERSLGDILFISGNFGVDLFFVISGFVICFSTEKYESHPCRKFIVRRFFRIYPLLILSVFCVYALSRDVSFYDFFRSIIPIHLDYSSKSPVFGYNILVSAWTITYEIIFYLLFLLALNISHKFRCELTILFLIIANVISNYYYFGSYSLDLGRELPNHSVESLSVIFSSSMLLTFIYGVLIYKLYLISCKFSLGGRVSMLYMLYLTLAIFIALVFVKHPYFDGHGFFRWGLLSFCIVFIILYIECCFGMANLKILSWLGEISYSLYLTHIVVLEFVFKKITPDIWNNSDLGFSKLFLYLFISLFFSHVIYILVERPFIAMGKKLIQKI